MVSSLLRPDGTVQTTSQVTLEQFPNFINSNEVQLFVQTHGLVHLRNVQAHSSSHSSSRSLRAMRDQATAQRSRSPVSRVRLTPGPHGQSEDEDDWGEWTRPRSPSGPPARHMASDKVDLLHLPMRNPVPSLGSHRLLLEEIAIMIDDVPYYTLPCIAEPVFPEPAKWKKSWETSYRSLMPHRDSIRLIQDQQRVRSVSELPDMRPPHGNPGSWTAQVIHEISREFKVSVDTLPEQLIGQLGVCEKCWPYIQKTRRSHCRFEPTKKDAWKNRFGILFLFEPRRQLPGNHRSQSISPFFWGAQHEHPRCHRHPER